MREVETIQGVTLARYAAIKAAIAEPFPVPEVLAIEGVAASAWQAADLGWNERLVPDGLSSGPLFGAYREQLAAAEDRLSRRVTPLDDDPAAWVAFLHAITTSGDAGAILDRTGLGPNDASRLSRRWSTRTAADAALEKRVAELAKKPGPLPAVSVEPAKLVSSRGPAARTLMGVTPSQPSGPALPFTRRAVPEWRALASAMEHAEAVQGPASSAGARAGGTLCGTMNVSDLLERGPALPFHNGSTSGPKTRAPVEPEALEMPQSHAPARAKVRHETMELRAVLESGPVLPFAAPAPPPAVHRPPSSWPPPSAQSFSAVAWSVEQYASLYVELHLYPDRLEGTLARYRLTPETRAALDMYWQARFTADTALRPAWERAYAQYRGHLAGAAAARPEP